MTGPERVTVNPDVMAGAPCVSGTRIPVVTVLGMLAAGVDPLAVFPELSPDDVSACLGYAAEVLDVDEDAPRWSRMMVGELLDQLDSGGNVIGLMNPDGTARAFVLKATPDVVRLIEDLTMRADVPPSAEDGG